MTTPDPAATPGPGDPEPDIIDAEIVDGPPPARPDLTLPPPPAFDYTDAGVPTLDYVRDRIEGRAAVAEGHQELQRNRVQEQQDAAAERERLAKAKLDEIRRSLGGQ